MNTRNSCRFQSGYYRNLSKTVLVDLPSTHRRLSKSIQETSCFQTLLKDFIDQLNFEIVCLLQKRSGLPYCSGRVQCKALFNIIKRYSLNKCYKVCDMFLRDFNIITGAFSDPKLTKIKNNSFRIKIHEKRKRMIDQNLSVGSPYIYLCLISSNKMNTRIIKIRKNFMKYK
jgi:hypothetical protein